MLDNDEAESGQILVIDDDAMVLEVSIQMLLRAGFRVDSAPDAESGWEALSSGTYELLITDYDMPGMTGLELIIRMRSSGLTLPVILMSGELPPDLSPLREVIQPGTVLPKPFSYEKLLVTVANEWLSNYPAD